MTAFYIGSTVIFFLAIVHTFLTPELHIWSVRLKMLQIARPYRWRTYYFLSEFLVLNSEVEVIFALWLVPLFAWGTIFVGWEWIREYVANRDFTFAVYIMVIVVVVGSRPIISFAERILEWFARIGKDSAGAWWLTIMTIGPLLGSVLKEPGAMALSAILLSKKFYPFQPSRTFQYATLGLLFANVSVGGLLSPYSSRALFFAAKTWDWNFTYMMTRFGWKVLVGICVVNVIYYCFFRKNFKLHFPDRLPTVEKDEERAPTPLWITAVHLLFVVLITFFSFNIEVFFPIFLIFLGFYQVTRFYQTQLNVKKAALVGLFFASLILHGELQGWWVVPLLRDFGKIVMVAGAFVLSAVADNAVINYLAVQIPAFSTKNQYLLVAASMSAGGVTVLANVANVVGLRILRPAFLEEISFIKLFVGALFPSLVYFALFMVFQ